MKLSCPHKLNRKCSKKSRKNKQRSNEFKKCQADKSSHRTFLRKKVSNSLSISSLKIHPKSKNSFRNKKSRSSKMMMGSS
jgi:hypothetical protein